MNPCPCGWYGDPSGRCTCSSATVTRYQNRISGPVLDRIDIHVEVPRVEYEKLSSSRLSEPSSAIRRRVEKARKMQHARFRDGKLACNADMGPAEVRQFCELDEVSRSLLRSVGTRPPAVPTTAVPPRPDGVQRTGVPLPAAQQMQFSARTYPRLLKVAPSIADLAEAGLDTAHHGRQRCACLAQLDAQAPDRRFDTLRWACRSGSEAGAVAE